MLDLLNKLGAFTIAALIASGALIVVFKKLKQYAADQHDHRVLAQMFRNHRWISFYSLLLQKSLLFYDTWFLWRDDSEPFISAKWDPFIRQLIAFGACLTIAYLYLGSFLLVAWVISGPYSNDVHGILPTEWPKTPFGRMLLILAFLLQIVGIVGVLFKADQSDKIWRRVGWASIGALIVAIPVVAAGVFKHNTFPIALSGLFIAIALRSVLKSHKKWSLVGSDKVRMTPILSLAGIAFLCGGIFMLAYHLILDWGLPPSGPKANIYALIVFGLIAFPSANAAVDWLSYTASRYFLGRLAKAKSPFTSVLWIGADLFVALVALIALAVTLGLILGSANSLLFHEPFDWRKIALQARQQPFASGLFISLMLLTTLVPTLIHFVFGVMALAIHWSPYFKKVAAQLDLPDEREVPSSIQQDRFVLLTMGYGIGASSIVFGGVYAMVWILETHGTTVFDLLISIAQYAARLVGDG